MINDKITVSNQSVQEFDKMQIALAIKNSTLEDALTCSLLINEVIDHCSSCRLKSICDKIDDLAAWYANQTTIPIKSFSFD